MIKNSIANYPLSFVGCKVSPTKICVQYGEVTSKLRYREGAEYIKVLGVVKSMPIRTDGTEVDVLAVGCQMPVLEQVQAGLIDAYIEYGTLYSDRYKEEYGKEFMDFLLTLKVSLDRAIRKIDKSI